MSSCTFFGHRNSPTHIKSDIRAAIVHLIEDEGVYNFYVGNQGGFDSMALHILRELAGVYPELRYSVVLAYHPTQTNMSPTILAEETILPEEVAACHPKFAIDKRNRWMVEHSDFVIAFARYSGGAKKFVELAQKKGKRVVSLAEME